MKFLIENVLLYDVIFHVLITSAKKFDPSCRSDCSRIEIWLRFFCYALFAFLVSYTFFLSHNKKHARSIRGISANAHAANRHIGYDEKGQEFNSYGTASDWDHARVSRLGPISRCNLNIINNLLCCRGDLQIKETEKEQNPVTILAPLRTPIEEMENATPGGEVCMLIR